MGCAYLQGPLDQVKWATGAVRSILVLSHLDSDGLILCSVGESTWTADWEGSGSI